MTQETYYNKNREARLDYGMERYYEKRDEYLRYMRAYYHKKKKEVKTRKAKPPEPMKVGKDVILWFDDDPDSSTFDLTESE